MNQDAFDSVLSALSRDSTLDRGWTEVKVSHETKEQYRSQATLVTFWEALKDLYWTGVGRDIAAAILSFAEIEDHHPEALPNLEPYEDSSNLAGLINAWDPYVHNDGNFRRPEAAPSLEKRVEASVSGQFSDSCLRCVLDTSPTFEPNGTDAVSTIASLQSQTTQEQRARSLLQACGIMDVDFVREYRSPSFRSWGQRPQVEEQHGLSSNVTMLTAVQCSQCRNCIRSFHYYQCRRGCRDSAVQRNRFKMPGHSKGPGEEDTGADEFDHWLKMVKLEEPPAFIICPACLPTCTHPRDHLRAVRKFCKAGDSVSHEFARELDAWEDYVKGRSLLAFGNIALERFVDHNTKAARYLPGSRTMFPAGNSHSALMFGPLLIENGMTITPGGAFLSIRGAPTVSTYLPKDIDEFLAEPSQFSIERGGEQEEKLLAKVYSVSPDRKLFKSEKAVRQRRFLSTRKQVSGGLFTGHCTIFAEQEDLIISQFITEARLWSLGRSPHESQSDNRALLKDCAQVITDLIREAFGNEIEKFLCCFAERLQKLVKLQYSRMSNNCQDFCNSMIFNSDKFDQVFSSVYPSLPPFETQGQDETCLRYLMSFAGRVSQHVPQGGPATVLATSVNVYDWFPLNDADIIDHVSSIRFKDDPEAFGLTISAGEDRCHDEYLLKDPETTCMTNYVNNKRCTLRNHLLDCPFDNLSVITMHIHRARELYTIPTDYSGTRGEFGYEEFLSLAGPKAWVENRLQVLHRLLTLNSYLACISREFQAQCADMSAKEIRKAWKPPPCSFGRARYDSTRSGNKLIFNNQSLAGTSGNVEGHMGPLVILLASTLPFMQSPDIFKSRWKAIKKVLKADLEGKANESDTPWENCACDSCTYAIAVQNCRRARVHAEARRIAGEKFSKSHPDYTPFATLQSSIGKLGIEHTEVVALIEELGKTPDYFEAG